MTVIDELKASVADREEVSQILAYLGDLMLAGKTVRGILVVEISSLVAPQQQKLSQICNFGSTDSSFPLKL
jgi:hypothetical protein